MPRHTTFSREEDGKGRQVGGGTCSGRRGTFLSLSLSCPLFRESGHSLTSIQTPWNSLSFSYHHAAPMRVRSHAPNSMTDEDLPKLRQQAKRAVAAGEFEKLLPIIAKLLTPSLQTVEGRYSLSTVPTTVFRPAEVETRRNILVYFGCWASWSLAVPSPSPNEKRLQTQ